ncbi:unnamed protein product [Closterium sp. Yama58-4]|nr:unnamed protein product [Closterium sp. Yama58-4]
MRYHTRAGDEVEDMEVGAAPSLFAFNRSPPPTPPVRHLAMRYRATAGDEVEDMEVLLRVVKKHLPDVQGVSVGAIASDYQRERVENVCSRLGLTPLAYLWQRPQKALLDDMGGARVLEAGPHSPRILVVATAEGTARRHVSPSLPILPCAVPPMRRSSHALFLPCAVPPMRRSSHALFLPCAVPPMRHSSHALFLPCAVPPMRRSSHAPFLPCAVPPMRRSSHAPFLPCAVPPMRRSSHAPFLPCAVPPMRRSSHAPFLPCAVVPSKFGVNVCGEGGEYETLTLDCPLFKQARIVVDASHIILHSPDPVAPVGVLRITAFHVAPKTQDGATAADVALPPPMIIDANDEDALKEVGNGTAVGEAGGATTGAGAAAGEESRGLDGVQAFKAPQGTLEGGGDGAEAWVGPRCMRHTGALFLRRLIRPVFAHLPHRPHLPPLPHTDLASHLSIALSSVSHTLRSLSLSWAHALYVHLYLADMAQFGAANSAYVRHITEAECVDGVPSRSTVELPLGASSLGGSGEISAEDSPSSWLSFSLLLALLLPPPGSPSPSSWLSFSLLLALLLPPPGSPSPSSWLSFSLLLALLLPPPGSPSPSSWLSFSLLLALLLPPPGSPSPSSWLSFSLLLALLLPPPGSPSPSSWLSSSLLLALLLPPPGSPSPSSWLSFSLLLALLLPSSTLVHKPQRVYLARDVGVGEREEVARAVEEFFAAAQRKRREIWAEEVERSGRGMKGEIAEGKGGKGAGDKGGGGGEEAVEGRGEEKRDGEWGVGQWWVVGHGGEEGGAEEREEKSGEESGEESAAAAVGGGSMVTGAAARERGGGDEEEEEEEGEGEGNEEEEESVGVIATDALLQFVVVPGLPKGAPVEIAPLLAARSLPSSSSATPSAPWPSSLTPLHLLSTSAACHLSNTDTHTSALGNQLAGMSLGEGKEGHKSAEAEKVVGAMDADRVEGNRAGAGKGERKRRAAVEGGAEGVSIVGQATAAAGAFCRVHLWVEQAMGERTRGKEQGRECEAQHPLARGVEAGDGAGFEGEARESLADSSVDGVAGRCVGVLSDALHVARLDWPDVAMLRVYVAAGGPIPIPVLPSRLIFPRPCTTEPSPYPPKRHLLQATSMAPLLLCRAQ